MAGAQAAAAASATTTIDVRELSFQNVVEQILKPHGVKVGGFPDEIFENLSDTEQAEYLCNIW